MADEQVRVGDKMVVNSGSASSGLRMAEVSKVLARYFEIMLPNDPRPRQYNLTGNITAGRYQVRGYGGNSFRIPYCERYEPEKHDAALRLMRLRDFVGGELMRVVRHVEQGSQPTEETLALAEALERAYFEHKEGKKP